jgi:oligopeptide transport system ATP-binding protein
VGELREKTHMSIILITHDLAVVAGISDRILVMYAGKVVESGTVDDIFYSPQHPYTQGLLASVPRLDQVTDDELHAIPGNPPNLLDLPSGCSFRDRCEQAREECLKEPPTWRTKEGRMSRCVNALPGGEIDVPEDEESIQETSMQGESS